MTCTLTVVSLIFFPLPVLSFSLIFAMFYYWTKIELETPLTFYGFTIKAYHLPFAILLILLLLGNSIAKELMGLICGHIFYYVKEVVPDLYGVRYLETPIWFKKFFKE
jgi:Derlin-2/3